VCVIIVTPTPPLSPTTILQAIARFLILTGHELLAYDRTQSPGERVFQSHLNQEQLNKVSRL
jgi:hypothetical protein